MGKRYESKGGGTTYYIADESCIGCLAILLSMLLPDFIIKRWFKPKENEVE